MNDKDSSLRRSFAKKAAMYIAEDKALTVDEALSYVYNSETFRTLEDGNPQTCGISDDDLVNIFRKEMSSGEI